MTELAFALFALLCLAVLAPIAFAVGGILGFLVAAGFLR